MAGIFDEALRPYEKAIDGIVESNVARGHSPETARVIAESFALYMIGYYTLEGAAQAVHATGIGDEASREAALTFRDAKLGVS